MDGETVELELEFGEYKDYVAFIPADGSNSAETIDFVMAIDTLDDSSDFSEIPESSQLTEPELKKIGAALSSSDELPDSVDGDTIARYSFLETAGADEHGASDHLYTTVDTREVYTAVTPEGQLYVGDKDIIRSAVPYMYLDDKAGFPDESFQL